MSRPQTRPPAPDPGGTVLHPAARVLWRSAHEAQLELGSRRVVLDGVGSSTIQHLLGRPLPASETSEDEALAALQSELLDAGYLWPAPSVADEPGAAHGNFVGDDRRAVATPRLAGELTALSARAGERAAELIAARRHGIVAVHGAGRAGPLVAAILAAAGVGRVHATESSPVRLHQLVPGGLAPNDEGAPFAVAAAAAAARQAPEAVCAPAPFGEPPDLVVLAVDEPVDSERRDALHVRCCPHLVVRAVGGHGVVGPLVLPGLTSCLRCADLHRLDRDPAWDALAVQLSVANPRRSASEVAVASLVGALAAVQALEFLDGGRPATVEGTLEVELPDWRLRRRTWPIHPDCDCLPGPGAGAT